MNFALHHIFILVETEALVAEELVSIGMPEAPPNVHQGQGTSNRRFFFSNCALELLWIHDVLEAENGLGKNMLLVKRSQDPQASPFGIILHGGEREDSKPFPGWAYQPAYFEQPWTFHVGANSSNILEPLCVYAPFLPQNSALSATQPFSFVSHVKVITTSTPLSPVLESIDSVDEISVEVGFQHLMIVSFGNGAMGNTKDFRPRMPLIVHW